MDQRKIGKFIAEVRKSKKLTQRQLGERLFISDKTVSKWECGNGLPEVSLMLPLCRELDITVNDLLSGEKVSPGDYQKKAEGNMVDLIKENEENKKRMALSIITGGMTLIAVCALVVIAAFMDLPPLAKFMVIALAAAAGAVGMTGTIMLDMKAGYFECPYCKERFVPTTKDYIKGLHTFTRRRLICPKCGKTGMCKHRVVR